MALEQMLAWFGPGSPEAGLVGEIDFTRLPAHIAIIMDGNGRWAAQRHLPRVRGHQAGVEAVRATVESSARLGISVLTLLSIAGAWRAFPALSVAQRAAIVIPLAAYPLVYYVVGFEARYRQPVDGLALVLAASALIGGRRPAIGVA